MTAVPVPGIARSTDPLGGTAVDGGTAASLARPSGGRPLRDDVRGQMEAAFGTDFGSVRVHDDARAADLSRSVAATAFTHGDNIYFGEGAYRPGTEGGSHLLAHELTHVVQGRSRGAAPAGPPTIGRADDPVEADADRVASGVVESLRRQAHRSTGTEEGPE